MAAGNPNRVQTQGAAFIVSREGDDAAAKKQALLQEIAEIEAAEKLEEQQRKAQEAERKAKEKIVDMRNLEDFRGQLADVDESLKYVTQKEDVGELLRQKRNLQKGISEIENRYGLNQPINETTPEAPPVKHRDFMATAWQIAALLAVCWGIVLFSGDWIVSRYPNAAVYNEVSFQKVLFGFSVYVSGVMAVIAILTIFFPGFGKYFNPFNHGNLDFFDDFKTLTSWQRSLIALFLFFSLFLAYAFIVAGKLD